ncbi:hypothetical protein L6452_41971 [Arctium lappa]|uniref:Uncharacterized protein n=1 Tax=Arctium lappa TaxID=4217 RepID=A0ACB8XIR0_ARCLA|nr:hypothetical protein L6452_41971 [Arctium lappa]
MQSSVCVFFGSRKPHLASHLARTKLSLRHTLITRRSSGVNYEKIISLESENAELKKNISDLEQKLAEDKANFESEKKGFSKKFSDFSRKCFEEKKSVELKCIKLSQQVSDFEKILILEREKFDKENKAIEQKNVGFFKEISGQRNNSEKGFEEERSIFETEIKRLTSKLSELSANALKEQKTKSKFSKKIDQLVKERDNFVSKIKELEKSVSKSNQKSVSSQRRSFKKEKLVWQKKPVKDEMSVELKGKTSCVLVFQAKKNTEHKGTSSQGGVREPMLLNTTVQNPDFKVERQWLLNNTVQDPYLNVKIMASKHISLGPVPQRLKIFTPVMI